MDVDDETRATLWAGQRIAIHYPTADNRLPKSEPDSTSLDPNDYSKSGRSAMRAMSELSRTGGYVCAEYYPHKEVLLGQVAPGDLPDFPVPVQMRGTDGTPSRRVPCGDG